MYDSGTQNQIDPTVATNIRIVYPMGRWETHTLFNLEHSVQARVFLQPNLLQNFVSMNLGT